jgi:transcription elongation factor GreA
VEAKPPVRSGVEEVVLTAEGYAKLEEEHAHLTTVVRPGAADRLSKAIQVAGDLADNPEYLDALAELDLVEARIALLERRLHAARVLAPDEPSGQVVSLGSRVVLEDLDESTQEEYVLVSSAESNPAEGRLSNESPVGMAIVGHHEGDVVDARAPLRVRHLRIADVRARR